MIFGRVSRCAAVALLLGASCGTARVATQDGSTSSLAPRASVNSSAAASATPRPAATGQRTVEVLVGDHFFDPQVLLVKVGTTVTWRSSSGTHDVTARDRSFRSPPLVGLSFSHTFTELGRHPYFCSNHAGEMQGEVIVEPGN
jgi:plastocyanin